MLPAVLITLMSVAAAIGATATSGTTAVTSAADTLLLASLRQRYPAVTRWDVRPLSPQLSPAGAGSASIALLGPRSAVRLGNKIYWYAVSGYQQVLSATRHIGFGQALDEHDAIEQEKDVLAAGCEPLTRVSELGGMRARHSIGPNDVICAAAVEPRPLVARGDQVTVIYVGNNVVLRTSGIAEKDGAVGETLLVRNPRSHDLFRAVVSGAGEVTVHE
jgi:flagella basal body P-ring formation protein FlgA